MTWWCATMDEVYGVFPHKKFAVAEVLKHLEAYKVRKINPGFYEYTEKFTDSDSAQKIWVMTEFEAILNGFKRNNE
ncbi:MAG: hypothetical protein M3N42_03820 [Cyanobacteriota bacterium]|nr:hypothetical protein [Cyanobacteriota bacterium]